MANFIPNKSNNEIEILAEYNDENLIKASFTFLENLLKQYSIYMNNIKKSDEEYNKILELNKKYKKTKIFDKEKWIMVLEKYYNEILFRNIEYDYYEESKSKSYLMPEILNRKSPSTILNGSWGSGKTYFIEKLFQNFLKWQEKKQEIKLTKKQLDDVTYFTDIIVIDTFKYVSANNIPEELIIEIFSKIQNFSDKVKRFIYSFLKETFITLSKPIYKEILKKSFGKLDKKFDKTNISNAWKKQIKERKIIIVLDNIERLGKHSWEVFKAINKISILDNFVFILPMDLDFLKNYREIKSNEFPIEKYIDLSIFNFTQNYQGYLNTIFQHDLKLAKIINEMLITKIDDKNLTIRQVKKIFENKKIYEIQDKNKLFKEILNNIWGKFSVLKNYFLENYINPILVKFKEFINNKIKFRNLIWYGETKKAKHEYYNLPCPGITNSYHYSWCIRDIKYDWQWDLEYIPNSELNKLLVENQYNHTLNVINEIKEKINKYLDDTLNSKDNKLDLENNKFYLYYKKNISKINELVEKINDSYNNNLIIFDFLESKSSSWNDNQIKFSIWLYLLKNDLLTYENYKLYIQNIDEISLLWGLNISEIESILNAINLIFL